MRYFRAFAILALTAAVSVSDTGEKFSAESSKVTVSGTSTAHDWTVEGTVINGAVEITPALPDNPSDLARTRVSVTAEIPVVSLKSGKRAMDEVMYKALKSKDHPTIRFVLTGIRPESGNSQSFRVKATGDLTVAGQTRRKSMTANVRRVSSSTLRISLSTTMKMTDFGIRPPTALLGAIRSGDTVTVGITWTVKK